MGLIDQKKSIFTTIGSYNSMMQGGTMPQTTNLFSSINNKKDVVPLLLDIMKVVVGSDALQELTGQLFTKFIDNVQPTLKIAVKNQAVQSDSGAVIPNGFKNNGYNVKVKDIDVYGLFKTNPSSTEGSMLYNSVPTDFNSMAYQAIQNAGTSVSFGGTLLMKYDSLTDTFNFKPDPAFGTNPKTGDFLNGFVDKMQIIDKKTFTTNVMNQIYGTIAKAQGKSVEEIAEELQINKLLDQLINDNDSFIISPQDYEALLKQAQEIANGVVYYDMGCGVMDASLPLSGLSNLISSISGSTDPFFVGNQINNTISGSTKNNPSTTEANKQTIKDGFFQKLIKLITSTLAQAVCTAPQIRTLLGIISGFQNQGNVQLGSPKDDLKKFKVYLKCIIKTAMSMINKFIFDLIVMLLNKLLLPVIKAIIAEKINQYVGALKSLTGAATG
jgi:hypothetical protein